MPATDDGGGELFGGRFQVEVLHFLPCPRGSAQKLQTGFDARLGREAFDRDAPAHLLPAEAGHKLVEDHFERDAVERPIRVFVFYSWTVT